MQRIDLVLISFMRIIADIGDGLLKILQLGFGFNGIILVEESDGVASIALGNNGYNRFTGQVSCDENDPCLVHVHLDGIQELAVGAVCSVQVGTHIAAKIFCHAHSSILAQRQVPGRGTEEICASYMRNDKVCGFLLGKYTRAELKKQCSPAQGTRKGHPYHTRAW